MKRLTQLLVLAAALGVVIPAAHAQVAVSSSVFYGSPYVWRGEVLSSGFVMQPYVEASYEGFSLAFFGNVDPNGGSRGSTLSLNEADLTAAYASTFGGVDVGIGYTIYTFPGYLEDELELSPTQEFFGSVGLSNVVLAPSLFVAYDFDAFEGLYAELGIGHTVNSGSQPIGLGLALGFDSEYALADGDSGPSHVALTAGTDFEAGYITISPMAGFQLSLHDDYKSMYGESVFYGGIGIGF